MASQTQATTEQSWYTATDSETDENDPLHPHDSSTKAAAAVPLTQRRTRPAHVTGALRRASLSMSRLIQLVAACSMLITNIVITVFSFIAYSKSSRGEVCQARPIQQYLLTAGLHATANIVFLSLFIIQIALKVCHTWQHSQHKRADRPITEPSSSSTSTSNLTHPPSTSSMGRSTSTSSVPISSQPLPDPNLRVYVNSDRVSFEGIGARYWLSCIETFLFALAFLQVGIAILGEVWLSGLGIIPVQAGMPSCITSAPVMYRYSLYIALYELWIIPVMVVFIVYSFFTCCSPPRKH